MTRSQRITQMIAQYAISQQKFQADVAAAQVELDQIVNRAAKLDRAVSADAEILQQWSNSVK